MNFCLLLPSREGVEFCSMQVADDSSQVPTWRFGHPGLAQLNTLFESLHHFSQTPRLILSIFPRCCLASLHDAVCRLLT
jgi:hypothetical protein